LASFDVIIIGAGHNGLVTASYLAKAGRKVLVLERRDLIGGKAVTEEIYPGFRYASVSHLAGSFARNIIGDLELKKHGLEFSPFDSPLFAPLPDGRSLVIPRDRAKIVEEISRFSKSDGAKFEPFCIHVTKLAGSLRLLLNTPMPDGVAPRKTELAGLIKLGWKFHRLGQRQLQEFLRVLPLSIADFLNEWFESEILKAALAATGLLGGFVGPRAQGTSLVFLQQLTNDGPPRSGGLVRGGIGNLTRALGASAKRFGAEIRTGTDVQKIITKDGKAVGVVLRTGEEISGTVIISDADVKRTFFSLLETTYLDPHLLLQVKNIRSRGCMAKINLALDSLPKFRTGGNGTNSHLSGVIHIGPTLDYLERAADDAKYGGYSTAPFLEITIPSIAEPSLAPAGKHVMSVMAQFAPYHLKDGNWQQQRDGLGDCVINLIESYAPGFKDSVLHRQVLTPLDLEEIFGLTEGHIYHAELALDQLFFMRPVPGWARYRTPIENLYLCGSGTHPGGGLNGLPGYFAARQVLADWKKMK
jgi:phytoene dehydrogenase-like protein